MLWTILVAVVCLGILVYKRPLWIVNAAIRMRLRLAGIHSDYVTVGPRRVHYFVGGKGKPLLLIHGLGARSEYWTPQMPSYAKNGFRVYAIDLLGCGQTDRPDIAYTMQQQADLVHGFLDAVHVRQADVVGWSMGGWVALEFGLTQPKCVRRLVLMASAGLPFQTSLTPDIFELRTIQQLKQLAVVLMPHPRDLPRFFQRDILRSMRRNSLVVHRALESMIQNQDSLDGRLGSLDMAILIVWGEQDALIPPSVGFEMHRQIPQSVLQIYSDCGHLGPAFCANRIVPRVQEFLNSDPPMAGGVYLY